MEPELSHDHFEFILKLLILEGILFKIPFEDGVHEDLVPSNSTGLIDLQASLNKIDSIWFQVVVHLNGFSFDIFY